MGCWRSHAVTRRHEPEWIQAKEPAVEQTSHKSDRMLSREVYVPLEKQPRSKELAESSFPTDWMRWTGGTRPGGISLIIIMMAAAASHDAPDRGWRRQAELIIFTGVTRATSRKTVMRGTLSFRNSVDAFDTHSSKFCHRRRILDQGGASRRSGNAMAAHRVQSVLGTPSHRPFSWCGKKVCQHQVPLKIESSYILMQFSLFIVQEFE